MSAVITWLIAGNSVCYPLRTSCKSFEMIPLLTDPISQSGTVQKVIRTMFSCQRSICFHTSLENWETRISILERMQSYLEHKLCNQVSFPHLTTENTPSSGSTSYFWTPNQGMKSLGLKWIGLKRWPTLTPKIMSKLHRTANLWPLEVEDPAARHDFLVFL